MVPLSVPTLGHVDEPQAAPDYAAVLSRVAENHEPVIVRRDGADLAAIIPLDYLELLQELLARQAAERLASQTDWDSLVKSSPPPQSWFEGDEPKPF
jgi:hypothetical protein